MKGTATTLLGAAGSAMTLAHFNDVVGAAAGVLTVIYMGFKVYGKLQKFRRKNKQQELFDTDSDI